MKELNPYWKLRQKSFWFDIVFVSIGMVSGWYLHQEYLKNTTLLKFLPALFTAGMAIFKLWQSLYKERK